MEKKDGQKANRYFIEKEGEVAHKQYTTFNLINQEKLHVLNYKF